MHRVLSMLSGTECSECAFENIKSFLLHFLTNGIFLFAGNRFPSLMTRTYQEFG